MRRLITILYIITVSNLAYSRAGFAEESFQTPGGHEICWCDPYDSEVLPVLIGWEDTIPNIEEFYFYKDHIIGYSKIRFFIFNEKTENIQVFNNRKDWNKSIDLLDLKPNKEKWLTLSDNKNNVDFGIAILVFMSLPLWLILLIIFIVQLARKKITKKIILYILLGIVLIIVSVKYYINTALDFMSY